ncbi:MAG: ABC transporter substrate-binding protein [Lachnospiraceae bacterium]|nr:ABC transporter substrate-binding protein [Lachnospiraceae bacterium]
MKKQRKLKVWLSLLLAVMMVAGLVGCSSSSSSSTSDTTSGSTETEGTGEAAESTTGGGTIDSITVVQDADPGTMNPWGSSSTGLLRTKLYVYQTLFQYDEEYNLTPIVGENWVQDDETHYTVTIQEGVYDSAGNKIDANDVLCSYQLASESSAASSTFTYVDIDNCQVIDDYTVQLAFTQETEFAFYNLMNQICVVSQASYEADPDEFVNNPVGSGPYVLDSWIVGTSMTLKKNENYWKDLTSLPEADQVSMQNTDTITIKFVSEASQRAIELETGSADVIYDCQATDVARFEENENYTVYVDSSTKTLSTYFNCTDNSACSDVRIRQAIAYAIDTVAIASVALEGYGEALYSTAHQLTEEWRDSYAEGDVYYAQDLEKAKELLAEAGYAEGELTLHVMVDETAMKRSAAQILQAACSEIGINVEIDQLETAVFQANIGDLTAWDMYMGVGTFNVYTVASLVTQIEKTGYPEDTDLRTAINEAFRVYDEETSDAAIAAWNEEIPIYYMASVQNIYVYDNTKIGNLSIDKNMCFWVGQFTSAS